MIMDNFTRHYLIAALWSSTDESTPEGGEPMDSNYDLADISEETAIQAQADCDRFRAQAGTMLEAELDSGALGWSPDDHEGRAAHDFWLTRNGHGAGFWDGDWPEYGDALTEICKSFGEVWLYVGDDGKIYG